MDTKELEQIIENHRHWLNEDVDGWEDMRADLSGANLRGTNLKGTNLGFANLNGTNLSGANLRGTNLKGTNLGFANLNGANLSGSYLSGAYLIGADLRGADLSGADLRDANLRYANLLCAYLIGANLSGTNLSGANLSVTNLNEADLSEADLRDASLRDANLSGAKNVPYIPMICPEEGSFIGYKKASGKIIKLCIPEDAKRSSATTRKCRCNKAVVLAIYELDGSISKAIEVASSRNHNFIYKINNEVVVDDFDENRWNECSTGIHFFMQRHEAINYQG